MTPLAPSDWTPSLNDSPYDRLGGAPVVQAIVKRFYDIMEEEEPALARLHPCDEAGHVLPENRERFAMFLTGWLGGPQDYIQTHGHPRLRIRHAKVPVDSTMRDAWLRCMTKAMNDCGVEGGVRTFLDTRLADLASFLRNKPDA